VTVARCNGSAHGQSVEPDLPDAAPQTVEPTRTGAAQRFETPPELFGY
jgi:hypothetical protein